MNLRTKENKEHAILMFTIAGKKKALCTNFLVVMSVIQASNDIIIYLKEIKLIVM